MSQNVAYDLFVPSDTRRDHCISASTAVCVVSPNFIGQASGNSTKTWPLRRTPTLGWKITHSGSFFYLVRLSGPSPSVGNEKKHRHSTLAGLKATADAANETETQSTFSVDTHQNWGKKILLRLDGIRIPRAGGRENFGFSALKFERSEARELNASRLEPN